MCDFLEEKRSAMPRFYFIGDEDLLEILGQARAIVWAGQMAMILRRFSVLAVRAGWLVHEDPDVSSIADTIDVCGHIWTFSFPVAGVVVQILAGAN